MNGSFLFHGNRLVEFIVENDIELIISLNKGSNFSFEKYSTSFKSYNENLIVEEKPQQNLIRKEINFTYDVYTVKFIYFPNETFSHLHLLKSFSLTKVWKVTMTLNSK